MPFMTTTAVVLGAAGEVRVVGVDARDEGVVGGDLDEINGRDGVEGVVGGDLDEMNGRDGVEGVVGENPGTVADLLAPAPDPLGVVALPEPEPEAPPGVAALPDPLPEPEPAAPVGPGGRRVHT